MELTLDEAIDDLCPAECGTCKEALPRPGEQCGRCGGLPEGMTRVEAAELLGREPGKLAELEADRHRKRAGELREQWEAEHAEADRILLAAELARARDEAEGLLQSAVGEVKTAEARLERARGNEATAIAARAEAYNLRRDYDLAVSKAVRFRQGTQAEIEARARLAVAETVLTERTQARDTASDARQLAEAALAGTSARVVEREQERDAAAAALANMGRVAMSGDTVRELAAPLSKLVTLAAFSQQGYLPPGEAMTDEEIGFAMAMAYVIAGASGVLDSERTKARAQGKLAQQAEDGTRPRVHGATVLAPGARAVPGGIYSPGVPG